ncbi:MAG: H-X9-DG-CTERM domain-containing protein, partial [Armatimonadota bacterium]
GCMDAAYYTGAAGGQCFDRHFAQGGWTFPYVKNMQVMQCPSSQNWPSYGYNGKNNQPSLHGLAMAQVASPASLIMMADTNGTRWIAGFAAGCCSNRGGVDWCLFPQHNEGSNIAFADGHVKWLKIENQCTAPGHLDTALRYAAASRGH